MLNKKITCIAYCHYIWFRHPHDLFKLDTRSHLHHPIGIGLQSLSKRKFLERYGIVYSKETGVVLDTVTSQKRG